jgi:hypothetical protein
MPGLVELQKKYSKGELIVVGVTFDTEDLVSLDQVAADQKLNYPLLAFSEAESGPVRENLGVGSAQPVTVAIGKDGKIAKTISQPMSVEEFNALGEEMKPEVPVPGVGKAVPAVEEWPLGRARQTTGAEFGDRLAALKGGAVVINIWAAG